MCGQNYWKVKNWDKIFSLEKNPYTGNSKAWWGSGQIHLFGAEQVLNFVSYLYTHTDPNQLCE